MARLPIVSLPLDPCFRLDHPPETFPSARHESASPFKWLSVPDNSIARVGEQALAVWTVGELAYLQPRTVGHPHALLCEPIDIRLPVSSTPGPHAPS